MGLYMGLLTTQQLASSGVRVLEVKEKGVSMEVTGIYLSNDLGHPIAFAIFCLVDVTH